MPRIQPPAEPYEPEIAESLAKWMPPGLDVGPPLIFRMFHVHPELASRLRVAGAGFLAHNRLPTRDREIVIDRVTGRHGAQHEWGIHAAFFGEQVGLTPAQLDSTVTGPRELDGAWTDDELFLMDAADELADTADLSDSTWAGLRARYDDEQLIELIILIGWYRTISSLCNALQLEPEPWGRDWPVA